MRGVQGTLPRCLWVSVTVTVTVTVSETKLTPNANGNATGAAAVLLGLPRQLAVPGKRKWSSNWRLLPIRCPLTPVRAFAEKGSNLTRAMELARRVRRNVATTPPLPVQSQCAIPECRGAKRCERVRREGECVCYGMSRGLMREPRLNRGRAWRTEPRVNLRVLSPRWCTLTHTPSLDRLWRH